MNLKDSKVRDRTTAIDVYDALKNYHGFTEGKDFESKDNVFTAKTKSIAADIAAVFELRGWEFKKSGLTVKLLTKVEDSAKDIFKKAGVEYRIANRGSWPIDQLETLGVSRTDCKKLQKLIDEKYDEEALKFVQGEWKKGTPHVKKNFKKMPTKETYDEEKFHEYGLFFAYDCYGTTLVSNKVLSRSDFVSPGDEVAWIVGPLTAQVEGVEKYLYAFYIY